MSETFYRVAKPTPDDESIKLQIKREHETFVVYKTLWKKDSKTGKWESHPHAVTTEDPLKSTAEAQQVYDVCRRQIAFDGFKHAFTPDAFTLGNTYKEIK